jgi:FixJ family two-component response regulator
MTDKTTNVGYRILVVDDEPSVLAAYGRTLKLCQKWDAPQGQSLQLDTEMFESCDAALEALDSQNPFRPIAVSFLDVRMPQMDGLAMAEQIYRRDPECHIVLVTGHSDVDLAEASRRVGRPDKLLYLQKPFHPMEICQFTAALCAKWSAEQQLKDANERLEAIVEQRTSELAQSNRKLRMELERRSRQETELEEKLHELERFNKLTVGRELRMIELKREVNQLAQRAGIDPPYELLEEVAPKEMASVLAEKLDAARSR